MSIIIPGVELPPIDEYLHLRIDGNGYVSAQISADEYVCSLADTDRKAIEIPPHGRCVDVDEMERFMSDTVQGDIRGYPYGDETWGEAFRWMDSRPTILQADQAKEDDLK